MNHVLLIGNLGRIPEIRSTANGIAVANFSLATTERWRDDAGERREETTWHRITAWRGLARAAQYLTTGDKVAITGRIRTSQYEKDGERRTATEIVAGRIEFLKVQGFEKKDSEGSEGESQGGLVVEEEDEIEIPF